MVIGYCMLIIMYIILLICCIKFPPIDSPKYKKRYVYCMDIFVHKIVEFPNYNCEYCSSCSNIYCDQIARFNIERIL